MTLLDPTMFREHETTTLPDEALQRLLDAAEGAINRRFGSLASLTEHRRGGGLLLFLSRPAGTITSITERYGDQLGLTDVVMDLTDYTLLPDGQTLRREWAGTHRADRWTDDVIAVYVPADDTAERIRVELALVKLDLTHNPGLSSEQIGDWSETYADNSAMNYGLERQMILDTLASGLGFA